MTIFYYNIDIISVGIKIDNIKLMDILKMRLNDIIYSAIIGTQCDNSICKEIIKNNLMKLWRSTALNDNKHYIIGIENGIAKACFPNTIECRMRAVSMGYDVLSVTEQEARILWKSNILIAVEKVDSHEIASEIKQFNI